MKRNDEFLKGKTVLVTAERGTFGNFIIPYLLDAKVGQVRVFSRDEDKQYHMRQKYKEHESIFSFVLGDVRDYRRFEQAMAGVDYVFHAAALKHIDTSEIQPMEYVRTNLLGTENLVRAADCNDVTKVVFVSTDKAVKPVNLYGMTKAVSEKIITAANATAKKTRFLCVRYGNVLGSRGSVVPFFKGVIEQGKTIPITHPEMTRFMLPLDNAIDLVLKAAQYGNGGEIFVKKMPGCRITDLAEAMGRVYSGKERYPTEIIGIRPGEKIHETLVSAEEMLYAKEYEQEFVLKRTDKNNIVGELKLEEYNSKNTVQLSVPEIEKMLRDNGWAPEKENTGKKKN